MTTNILIPTDGTEFCEKAVRYGVSLAKQVGARVTGVTVTLPMRQSINAQLTPEVQAAFKKQNADHVKAALAQVSAIAGAAGVACDTVAVEDEHAYNGILSAARAKGCDLIVMASHGRRGLAALVIGSETQKVLTHADIPVLVCR